MKYLFFVLRPFLILVGLVAMGSDAYPQFLKFDFTKNQLKQYPKKHLEYDEKTDRSQLKPYHNPAPGAPADAGDTAVDLKRLNFLSQAVALPFKYRIQKDGQWEAGFSLGSASGIQWMVNKKDPKSDYLGLLFFVGASQLATIDSTNSKDTTGATRIGPSFAFTGFWELTKFNNFDIEFTVGWDYDPKNTIDRWKYNGKPWISFGFGINLTGNAKN
jgi:hypothetical protein